MANKLSIFGLVALLAAGCANHNANVSSPSDASSKSVTVAPADQAAAIQADGDIPIAPPGYRRPEGWKHKGFKWDIPTIAARASERQMKRAAKEMSRVDRVNAAGRYKGTAESIDTHPCPEWFVDAKLGIFIDWGPWSVAAYCPYVKGANLYPDWYEYRCRPGQRDHDYHVKNWGEDFVSDDFIDLFQGRNFDAEDLISTFKSSGARYVVPFLKHHGGFCLWNSSWTYRDSYDRGARRDFAKEMSKACKAQDMKFGIYTSMQGEWDYPVISDDGSIKMLFDNHCYYDYDPSYEGVASGKVPVRDVFRECMVPQTIEFIDKYDPDIIWYDDDWTIHANECGAYDVAAYFYNKNEGRKEVAVNDRYGLLEDDEDNERVRQVRSVGRNWGRTVHGDFFTDEWGDTDNCLDPASWHPWESCSGISKAYGNHWMETVDKTLVMDEGDFIRHFSNIVARGGNLLLLVNLDPQGAMIEVQKERLLQIGSWLDDYGEAIFDTRIMAPYATEDIDYTQAKDGSAGYAIVRNPAAEVTLRCEVPEGAEVTELKSGEKLGYVRDGESVRVSIPRQLASGQLPFALKIQ